MKLTTYGRKRAGGWMGLCLIAMGLMGTALGLMANAQAVSTTTVQGTVYLANGQAGAGTLDVSWPAFTTAAGQAIAADRLTVTIGQDGFLNVNLAPNLGATPAGLYYTAIYHMSDGTTSTEYWVVPAAAQASVGQVRAKVMPSVQAVQAVSKAYVDQAITELSESLLTASGGTLSGPLYLNGDPTQPLQAADKHYVDSTFSMEVPISGGSMTGALSGPSITATQLGGTYQVDQFLGADFGAKLQACLGRVNATYGGTCDARNFSGTLSMGSNVTISTANATILLPCATISTASQLVVTAGTRNVALRGCALRGASTASGSQGGTVLLYSGTGAMVQVGDPTYATDTMGFHLDNVVINTTAASNATAQALTAYRTQELDLESLYLLGNSNQTGMTLDGTGNYTGGTFVDNAFNGFQTAVNAIGHQIANPATTDWLNASTFVRLHIDCPTSAGNPVSGTYGINLQQGDGNTFTGGDVEGCSTALHLGPNAQNNTIVGLRNEDSSNQVVADAGSSYNNWITGGTMFTGQLTDNGTRNSFLDSFHRSFNGIKGDWYGSQQDATVTNHYRIGIGAGNERGLLDRYQTDYGYRWTTGLSDATAGEQFYQVLDELNNVYRLSIGQYNNGQSTNNNQTVINAAGTGAIVLNGSNNSGTGGVIIGSGGASESTVATISNAGNAQFNGTLQVGGASTFIGSTTVKNQADAEIDQILWAGATANQKESLVYKDWSGNSQWYMVKDANNNWALNSATGGLDSFKAYQSGNSGDTYINSSNSSGVVRLNYESGSSGRTYIYGGSSNSLIAAFSGTTAISFPGLAASSGRNCLQIDNSGYISNTGSACGTGSGGTNGTVNSGNAGQVAYYAANGTVINGMSALPITAGGTGTTTAAAALANLGAQGAIPGLSGDGQATPGIKVAGDIAAGTNCPSGTPSGTICSAGAAVSVPVASVAALRALTVAYPFVRLQSYDGTSATMQAAGEFKLVATGAATALDNGGTIFVTTTGGLEYQRVYSGRLNVAWFGAVADYTYAAGTGTDNAAAFNSAIAAGSASGQDVSCPSGGTAYYYISTSIALKSGTHLVGDIPMVDNSGNHDLYTGCKIIRGSSAAYPLLSAVGVTITSAPNGQIKATGYSNMLLDGNSSAADMVDLFAVTGVYSANVSYFNCGGKALYTQELFDSFFYEPSFSWCGSSTNAVTVLASGTNGFETTNQVRFINPRWEANAGTDVQLYGTSSSLTTNKIWFINAKWDSDSLAAQEAMNGHNAADIYVLGEIVRTGNGSGGALADFVHFDTSNGIDLNLVVNKQVATPTDTALTTFVTLSSVDASYIRLKAFGASALTSGQMVVQSGLSPLNGAFVDIDASAVGMPSGINASNVATPRNIQDGVKIKGSQPTLAWANNSYAASEVLSGQTLTRIVNGVPTMYETPNNVQHVVPELQSYASPLTSTETTQATALPLAAQVNIFTTVATGSGAVLPASSFTDSNQSGAIEIYNLSGTSLLVYPPSGAAFSGFSTNAAVVVPGGANATFRQVSAASYLIETPRSGVTGSIGGSALTAGQCASGTASIASANPSGLAAIVATPSTYPGDGFTVLPYVSAWGTVTVKVCAIVAGTPSASAYQVRIIP